MGARRYMILLSYILCGIGGGGWWSAWQFWLDYDFRWRKLFEMPLGPALLIGFCVLGGIVLFAVGVLCLLWATEEEEPNE